MSCRLLRRADPDGNRGTRIKWFDFQGFRSLRPIRRIHTNCTRHGVLETEQGLLEQPGTKSRQYDLPDAPELTRREASPAIVARVIHVVVDRIRTRIGGAGTPRDAIPIRGKCLIRRIVDPIPRRIAAVLERMVEANPMACLMN